MRFFPFMGEFRTKAYYNEAWRNPFLSRHTRSTCTYESCGKGLLALWFLRCKKGKRKGLFAMKGRKGERERTKALPYYPHHHNAGGKSPLLFGSRKKTKGESKVWVSKWGSHGCGSDPLMEMKHLPTICIAHTQYERRISVQMKASATLSLSLLTNEGSFFSIQSDWFLFQQSWHRAENMLLLLSEASYVCPK